MPPASRLARTAVSVIIRCGPSGLLATALWRNLGVHVETVQDLYRQVRARFTEISVSADRMHERRWGDTLDAGAEYAWFEALAEALDEAMRKDVPYAVHRPLLEFLAGAFSGGSEPVRQCIDVSFVENLFWNVPSAKCQPYWKQLPPQLSRLYLAFHRRAP